MWPWVRRRADRRLARIIAHGGDEATPGCTSRTCSQFCRAASCAPGAPLRLASRKFQAGVGGVDGADLEIHEAGRKPDIANDVFVKIARHSCALLRPADPNAAA